MKNILKIILLWNLSHQEKYYKWRNWIWRNRRWRIFFILRIYNVYERESDDHTEIEYGDNEDRRKLWSEKHSYLNFQLKVIHLVNNCISQYDDNMTKEKKGGGGLTQEINGMWRPQFLSSIYWNQMVVLQFSYESQEKWACQTR